MRRAVVRQEGGEEVLIGGGRGRGGSDRRGRGERRIRGGGGGGGGVGLGLGGGPRAAVNERPVDVGGEESWVGVPVHQCVDL